MSKNPTTSGSLFLVSAPSGAGKSSLVNALLKLEPSLQLSISFTTRAPRPGEQNGREYHFITIEDFLQRKNHSEFLEFAEVHGNYYGTSKILIQEAMQAGTDILLEIDWQGAQQVKKQFPDVASVFILPPSLEALNERLNKRGQDSQEVISRRILAAGGEIAHAPEFEYVIINQDFELALSELSAIVKATRCRTSQQSVRNAALFAQLGI
ncbi:guanylate kinase [Undibacterium danionis]|uniref:Guanylate kinase n=1 Tax=Undibacterium danionis TaxID=1812100 RepID=A0ABV6I976_9BURK